MEDFGKVIEDCIKETVDKILSKREIPDIEYIETDNLAEILEKLIIIHIRMWMLEDAVQSASSNDEIAELKRKIDMCFKVKRPKLVQAVNVMFDDAILRNKSLREDSVKLYKGLE